MKFIWFFDIEVNQMIKNVKNIREVFFNERRDGRKQDGDDYDVRYQKRNVSVCL